MKGSKRPPPMPGWGKFGNRLIYRGYFSHFAGGSEFFRVGPECVAGITKLRDGRFMTERATRAEIKAAGGAAYEALLVKERANRARFRTRNPERYRELRRKKLFKTALCASARFRGRKKGLPATITPADIRWPTHCPVLGLALDYPERSGERGTQHAQPNWPSLDRWKPELGYVPGNVFVISVRANTIKSNATWQELQAVVRYARDGLNFLRIVA